MTVGIMDVVEIRQRAKREVVVAIEEEWGFRYFIWIPGMSGAELESWWLAMEDVETFWKTEPGTKIRLRHGWPGEFIDAGETDCLYELWSELVKTAPYISHIDMNWQMDMDNPDTFLKRQADGKMFVHIGATGSEDEA